MDGIEGIHIIIIGIPLALAGVFTWWILGRIGDRGKHKQEDQGAAVATSTDSEGARELLRVSRMENDKLAVLIQGRPYRRLQEVADSQVGRETIEAIKAVLEFAKDWLPAAYQDATLAQQQPASRDTAGAPPSPQKSYRPTPSPPATPAAPPDRSILHRPGRMLDPLTFIEDIDALVQQRLKELPGMADHNIRLTTGVGGGLRIYVDQQIFEAVGDITDSQVREIIQNAIREWEGE